MLSSTPLPSPRRRTARRFAAALTGGTMIAAGLVASPATAAVSTDAPVLINEVYGGGGNSGAAHTHDFIELTNPGDTAVALDGWSVQYASAAGNSWSNLTALTGSIPAGGTFLVQGASGGNVGTALPTPDVTGSINLSGTSGKVALVDGATALTCGTDCTGDPAVIDLVGYGAATDFAGNGPAPQLSNSTSAGRVGNTADNATDFVAGVPTPENSSGTGVEPPEPPGPATEHTIAEIQGTGDTSPLVGQSVQTSGIVTATYTTGGLNGFVIQTPGTGTCRTEGASDAIFVYGMPPSTSLVGTRAEVVGTVSEYNGLTQITADTVATLPTSETVEPAACPWPSTDTAREAMESMLILPTGDFTVTNTYTTHQYGEVGLAAGTSPLIQPTDAAPYGSAQHDAIVADNAARGVVLDDGSSRNFTSSANLSIVPPYVTADGGVRVGAAVTFTEPVILDYRNNTWKVNPTGDLSNGAAVPVDIENSRTPAPDAAALGAGDLTVASFNVLNYFTTTGDAWPAGCTYYTDRDGLPTTVNTCSGNGPRGAYDAANLTRQQDKIVAAITGMGADVIGLLEIENSAALGETPDEATATLVGALNAAEGAGTWAFVPSSTDLPPVGDQDVITNALIYRTSAVDLVGTARALGDQSSGSGAFATAREPIGQAFAPVGGGEPFFVAVNHFKSKSAGSASGQETDQGQGAWNALRTRQATALATWVEDTALPAVASESGTTVSDVFLVGDFNAYSQEDPILALAEAGYTDLNRTGYSYSYDGLSGSLDHVLANTSARARVTGSDVWGINSPESIALEYSRYRATAGEFYTADVYRSSDHDPVIVGVTAEARSGTQELNILGINDFHGRIDENTVAFAGTVEQLRADAGEENTLFVSAGDNIGASLFASSLAADQPTIDVLNALELQTSAVGNHEFDRGWDDLSGRVTSALDAPYLGANVYLAGTTTPALPEYELFDYDGLTVAVIGAVTQETPTLVSPAGVSDLEFGDPVEAVNRVAAQLTDGNPANGEADVLIAAYHEGAGAGTPDGATLEQEIAGGGTFAQIVQSTSPEVDVLLTGHTHKEYVWDAPVPGATDGSTRPIVQTGSYGERIAQVELTIDSWTGDVLAYDARNVTRTTVPDQDLIDTYPRVAQVADIVSDALDRAEQEGSVVIGSVTDDITTAHAQGSYVNGVWTGGTRDDRAEASALATLVGNALRDTLSELPDKPDIGVVNPGGLRAELLYGTNGEITVADARAVLPFNNELSIAVMTGEQIVTLLEQQWQRDENGAVPSRPYLQLGFSDNLSYTYQEVPDPAAPDTATIGVIGSVSIDGVPIDPAAEYTVGTFSFLAAGGDNFRVFTDAVRTVNTGLLDYEGWMNYLTAQSPVSPTFARAGVHVAGLPSTLVAGQNAGVTVSRVDVPSLGAPQNTEVVATIAGREVGRAPLVDSAAALTLAVPADLAGDQMLTLAAAPSGTTVQVPVSITPAVPPQGPVITLSAGTVQAGDPLTITVSGAPELGSAQVILHSTPVELGTLQFDAQGAGSATVTIPATTTAGAHTVQVVGGDIDVSAALIVTAAPGAGGGPGSGGGAGGGATTVTPGGPLALTGLGLLLPLLVALVAVGSGIGVVAYRKRHRV